MAKNEVDQPNDITLTNFITISVITVVIGLSLNYIIFPLLSSDTPRYLQSREQRMQGIRDLKRTTDLPQIQTELSLYEDKYGNYPKSLTELKDYSSLIDIKDPKTNKNYAYATTSSDVEYCLGTCLETDDAPLDHSNQCANILSLSCGTNTPYAISGR